MNRDRTVLAAASVRFALASFAMVLLPLAYPGIAPLLWVYGLYLGVSALAHVLISKDRFAFTRPIVFGVIDLALITFTVHRIGSLGTMLVSVYVLATALNTLVVGRRVGLTMALVASLMYWSIVLAERGGALPYAPDAPPWTGSGVPDLPAVIFAGTLLTIILLVTTSVVGLLLHTNRTREAQLLEANRQLEELSQRDPLTQLFNRRHLVQRLREELAWVRRGRPLAVIMIDLDGFKRVNDQDGHLQGDALLRELADALRNTARATDVAGRYGGDEFVIVLPDTVPQEAVIAAERLNAAIREIGSQLSGKTVTGSAGVAFARVDDSPDDVLRRADANAYRAKQSGGDRVVATVSEFPPGMDEPRAT